MGLEIEGKEISVIKAKNARYRQKDNLLKVTKRISNECDKVAVAFGANGVTVFGYGCKRENRKIRL